MKFQKERSIERQRIPEKTVANIKFVRPKQGWGTTAVSCDTHAQPESIAQWQQRIKFLFCGKGCSVYMELAMA